MKNQKDAIIALRKEGKSYDQIRKITGASKGTISFHCGKGQKLKYSARGRKNKSLQHPFLRKIESFHKTKCNRLTKTPIHKSRHLIKLKIDKFCSNRKTMAYQKPTFTVNDVIEKFGSNPTCYLTGDYIDINQPRTYHFDHIVPVSKGGTNTLDNLGICTKNANQAKHDMSLDEFLELCSKVLKHNSK